jgi:hypothetical protein
MHPDDAGIEYHPHRDAADESLQHRQGQDRHGRREQIASRPQAQQRDDHGDGHEPHDDRQQAVAEFDPAVDPHLGRGDERSIGAERPGGTAQP